MRKYFRNESVSSVNLLASISTITCEKYKSNHKKSLATFLRAYSREMFMQEIYYISVTIET